MKTFTKLLTILFFLSWTIPFSAQPIIKNFSDKNDVYSIASNGATIIAGTSGGVVIWDGVDFPFLDTITVDNGLASNFITAIALDGSGSIYYGSFDNGISVYNGTDWKYYNNANSGINNRILSLAIDQNNILWAGTPTGVYSFNGTTWTSYNSSATLQGQVNAISTANGKVWFGTEANGLYLYDGSANSWQNFKYVSATVGPLSNSIKSLYARNDSVLIGTTLGLCNYDITGGSSTWSYYLGMVEEINAVTFQESLGQIFVGTATGVYFFNGFSWTPVTAIPVRPVKTLISHPPGYIFAGFGSFGGGLMSNSANLLLTPEVTVGKNIVKDMVANGGNVWVATYGNGISRYDGNTWQVFNSLSNNYTNSVAMQKDTLWVGTDNGALSYNGVGWTPHATIVPKVNAVANDVHNPDIVWCGTAAGVTQYTGNVRVDYTTVGGLLANEVIAITVDSNNDVWFLHKNGITRFHNNAFDLKVSLADLQASDAELSDIDADKTAGIWISSNRGVIFYNNGSITRYTTSNGLTDNQVLSVMIDDQNNKYFGTNAGGINMLSPVGWQKITRENGIPMNRITSLCYQTFGNNIWSGGDWGGVSRIHFEPFSVTAYTSWSSPCFRDQITLYADVKGGFGSTEYIYNWTSSSGTFTSSNATETFAAENSDVYHLEVNDGFFSGNSQVSVNVNIVDTSQIFGPSIICPNEYNATYYVPIKTNRYYTWDIAGGQILGDIYNDTIQVMWDTNQSNGTIYLYEGDGATECSIYHDPVTIGFDHTPSPNIVRKGENMIICTDSGMVAYQWYFNEQALPNEMKQFYFYDSDPGLPAGVYNVEIENVNACRLFSDYLEVLGPGLKLYPVPANNLLNIEFSSENMASGVTEVYNLSGKKIDEIKFDKNTNFEHLEINVSNYKPGIYNYRIFLDSKQIKSGKFIVD